MSVQPQTIHELYSRQAEILGDTPAVKGFAAPALSYRGVIEQMHKLGDALNTCGVGRGDRVLIRLANGPEPLLALHGVASVAVAFAVDPSGSATELEHFLRFVQPKAIILQHGVDTVARALARQFGVRVIDIIPTPESGAGSFDFAESFLPSAEAPTLNGPDDLSYLLSTSGTTALPKLVPKTQRAMLATISIPMDIQQRVTKETLPLHLINFLPLHIAFAMMMTSSALLSGGSVVCLPRFAPEKFFEWLDLYRPSFVSGPPAILEQILALAPRHPDVLARYRPRFLYTASATLPDAVRTELFRVFQVPLWQGYGMTEIGGIASRIANIGDAPTPSVGRVRDLANTRVRADDGTFLPAGQVGEIVVRTGQFAGYWNNPEASEEAFVDGWFRTGDEGSIDVDGYLTLVGRLKEVINSGGAKVSPYEVETILEQHPQVRDAAVFGLKHPELGEMVAAAVVGDVTERELRKFASERLPFYKVPTRIVVVDEIPVAASGKVQRNRLAELLGLQ